MQLMQGKTVLITGGHTGVGYETAKDLLRRGSIQFSLHSHTISYYF
jgi:NAD(P)-dependent dehydrogenase (short-subunit alcohol dehydrogenase family)